MKETDYSGLQASYGGKFVALRGGEVVASAPTMGGLFRILKDRGLVSTDVTVEHVRPKDVIYAL